MLWIWTLYCSPDDYPGLYVLRRFGVGDGRPEPVATEDVVVGHHVEPLRGLMRERGMTRLERSPGDHPSVVETWV